MRSKFGKYVPIVMVMVLVLFAMGTAAMATNVVVTPMSVGGDKALASVTDHAQGMLEQTLKNLGANVITDPSATGKIDGPAAAALAAKWQADRVLVASDTADYHAIWQFPFVRHYKGGNFLDYVVYDQSGKIVDQYATDKDHPWEAEAGEKVNTEITNAGMLIGGLMASDHLFANHVLPYTFEDHAAVRGVGFGLAGLGYLAQTQANPLESASAATGAVLWGRNIFPAAGRFVQYGVGGALMLVPLTQVRGNPKDLELVAFQKALHFAVEGRAKEILGQ